MKRIFTLAIAAAACVAASAQCNVEPGVANVIKGGVATLDYVTLSDQSIEAFKNAGAAINYVGPDPDNGRNLWLWDGTFVAGDPAMRVDYEEGECISLVVSNVGWSGAGFAVDAPGLNLSNFNDDTHFHLAYCSPNGNAPASISLIILDQESAGSIPAKVALGEPFVDGDKGTYPSIGSAATNEWQAVDITLGDLKKFWPAFNLQNKNAWQGNLLSFLAGGVQGKTLALDAIYFYNTKSGSGVEGVEAEGALLVVGNNTVNSSVAGIEIYNLQGALVAASASTVAGIDTLPAGVYVAKSGNAVKKFIVK